MSVDPRGTATPRGHEWRKCVHGKIGILPIADHAAAVTRLLQTYSFMDPARIGIWGWSGGGSSTAHLMFKYPDIYSTGIPLSVRHHLPGKILRNPLAQSAELP